ncbi:hypothetical protein LCGC14_0411030 [marine sediment metagenome]|uniref:C2H2-type domain-containing protein n=1 Tax=marine sediment metagenome TaxID=412755 RepID=A0A0F9TBT6_9ZZZZ
MSRLWEGKVECGICEARFGAEIELLEHQELDEPMVLMECAACGSMTCHVCLDADEELIG